MALHDVDMAETTADNEENEVEQSRKRLDYTASIEREMLVEYLDAVRALVEEARLKITEDGWSIKAIDPANVAGGFFELSDADFHEHSLSGTEAEIGFPLGPVRDALEELPDVEVVQIGLNRNDERFELAAGGYSYSVEYIEPSKIRGGTGELENIETEIVEVRSGDYSDAIQYLSTIDDKIRISYEADDKEVWLEAADGGESGEVYLDIQSQPADGDANALYSKSYIGDMAKAFPNDADIVLEWGVETPLKMRYERGASSIEYVMAPRIEQE